MTSLRTDSPYPPPAAVTEDSRSTEGLAVSAAFAVATLILHALTYRGYGYFRDELYFMACGDRPDWAMLDHPPLVALVSRVSRSLLGESLFSIRLFSMLASALQVFFAGWLAREFGGKRFGVVIACLATMTAPLFIGTYLGTDDFAQLFWVACAAVVARLVNGGDRRLWLLFGVLAGIGLEGKHSLLFFGFALFVGLLVSPQRVVLREPLFWAAGAAAILLFAPNLLWEYKHRWPTLELLKNIARSDKNVVLSPFAFLRDQIILMGPLSSPIWIAGTVWLLASKKGSRFRSLGWGYLVAFATFVVLKGKNYCLGRYYPILFAAGSTAIADTLAARRRLAGLKPVIAVLIVVQGALLLPFAQAVLPPRRFIAYEKALHMEPPPTETHEMGPLPQQFADMFGWPELAARVVASDGRLSPNERSKSCVFAQNYGEAGAIDFFGRAYGPPPAISGHQNDFLWGPRNCSGEVLIVIGGKREDLDRRFDTVEVADRTESEYAMPYENHLPIYVCRRLKTGTLAELASRQEWR